MRFCEIFLNPGKLSRERSLGRIYHNLVNLCFIRRLLSYYPKSLLNLWGWLWHFMGRSQGTEPCGEIHSAVEQGRKSNK